jgi:acetoin:2,6-dichlorophenolindophenol oxidoreductase subunit beta
MRKLTYIEAIVEAMREEMERDESVFVIGEDVDICGGVWKGTVGLLEKFGAKRVRGTPISEAAFTGIATGSAMTGLRPIMELMYMPFCYVAMDQFLNQMAKLTTMSGGQIKLPVTIRAQAGAGTREAAQHSQSQEAIFLHIPGFKVVMPATVYDAKGLLKAAIRDDHPVLFIEDRNLYYEGEEVPVGEWIVPLGQAEVARPGKDATVVTLGFPRRKALAAAKKLEGTLDVEVIDARSLHPLDMDTIGGSVMKTGRILVVHEAPVRCGAGAEIVRRVVDGYFDYLDAEPRVLGGANVPLPFSPVLEDACLPQVDTIIAEVKKLACA